MVSAAVYNAGVSVVRARRLTEPLNTLLHLIAFLMIFGTIIFSVMQS